MADREKVIKGLQNLRDAIATDFIHEADQAVGTIDDAIELLKEQQNVISALRIIDEGLTKAVLEQNQIVRCKECKHRNEANSPYWEIWCERNDRSVDGDWFCADGEQISE